MTELTINQPLAEAGRPRGWAQRVPALGGRFLAERERWILWAPVALALGDGTYFGLRREPVWPIAAGIVLVGLIAIICVRLYRPHHVGLTAACLAPVLLFAAGFGLAQFETWRAAAPVLDRQLFYVTLSGTITDIEAQTEGTRLTIAPAVVGDMSRLPRLVRVKTRQLSDSFAIGDRISAKATLMPPPGPALPGGFDFQRQAFFKGIGAVGYSLGKVAVDPAPAVGVTGWLRGFRMALADRIRRGLPGASGAVAASLITGERGAIPASVNEDYRNSGLSHLLVIAGLHMSLVTGFVYFASRAALALIPWLALRLPIKKIAAAAALLTAAVYLLLSGAAIPTQRAFVMVGLALAAVLADRSPVSMRSLALAATAVLVLDPASLTGVSFQMSFAAVVGLIAVYETWGQRLFRHGFDSGMLRRFVSHLGGIVLTTVVTTLATAAFSIYHFNRFALFSVLANAIAVPLAGFWVMPLAVFSCLLLPLGLERLALTPMGWGLDVIDRVAHWTSSLAGAVLAVPTMPLWGLLAITGGGLWLALWRGDWRHWGLLPLGLGIASFGTLRPPDLIISQDGKLAAIRDDAGYLLSSGHADRIEAEAWLRMTGLPLSGHFPQPGEAVGDLRCDASGCILWHGDQSVAFVHTPDALDEDCRVADLLISDVPAPGWCRQLHPVIDHPTLRRTGATAIWFEPKLRIETANGDRGTRPWVVAEASARSFSIGGSGRPAVPEP